MNIFKPVLRKKNNTYEDPLYILENFQRTRQEPVKQRYNFFFFTFLINFEIKIYVHFKISFLLVKKYIPWQKNIFPFKLTDGKFSCLFNAICRFL